MRQRPTSIPPPEGPDPGHRHSTTRDGPVIAGHEPRGVVVAAGAAVDAKEARIGQRVMVHHYQGCTQCNHCRSGWQQLCQAVPVKIYGNNAHGGHAQFLKVPANTLVAAARRAIVLGGGCDRLRF